MWSVGYRTTHGIKILAEGLTELEAKRVRARMRARRVMAVIWRTQ